jgi:hypothetical protein
MIRASSGARTGETNANESVAFRFIPAFVSFRCTINRVYNSVFVHLFRPFRAADVPGAPFTQGGARRLRRLALPWAKLFSPFGAWRFLDAWPVSSGLVGAFGTQPT